MPFQATVYRVMIASPSDVKDERKAIAGVIHDWNSTHAAAEQTVLLPVMWETDAAPQTGDRPQAIINKQLVRDSDVLIGVFWTRIGTATGKAESGTVEEIRECLDNGKRVMLYFSDRSIPPSKLNRDQHQKLEEFKRWCQENGIYGTFRTVTQLKTSLSNHLTRTLRDLRNVDVASPQDDEERLRRLEVMAIDNARSESIRDMAGDSPVDASFLRQDMSRKACLSFLTGGSSLHGDTMTLPFRLRNEGQHPAYDVDVSVDSDQGPVMTNAKALEISSYKEHSFSFSIPRPPREDPPPDRLWTFTVRVRFRDGLGSDEAAFVFTFGGRDPYFNQHEDVERAQLSRLCRYVRPRE